MPTKKCNKYRLKGPIMLEKIKTDKTSSKMTRLSGDKS